MTETTGSTDTSYTLISSDELGRVYAHTRELKAEVERLRANQKQLIEAANIALEYFRIEGQYEPDQRGLARLAVEGKLRAAMDKTRQPESSITYQQKQGPEWVEGKGET